MFAWSASPVTQPENENDRGFFCFFVFVKNKLIFVLNTYWCCLVTNKGADFLQQIALSGKVVCSSEDDKRTIEKTLSCCPCWNMYGLICLSLIVQPLYHLLVQFFTENCSSQEFTKLMLRS